MPRLLAAAHLYMNNHNKHWDINSIFLFHNKHRANIEQKIKTQPQRITPFRKTKGEHNQNAYYSIINNQTIRPEVRIFLQGSRETSGIIEAYHHAHATWTGRVLINYLYQFLAFHVINSSAWSRFVESGLILFQV
ncbi:hypothetical protein ACJX0J_034842 [Zea mays]